MPSIQTTVTAGPTATNGMVQRKPDVAVQPVSSFTNDILKLTSTPMCKALAAAEASALGGDSQSAATILHDALLIRHLGFDGALALAKCATALEQVLAQSWLPSKSDMLALGVAGREALGAAIPYISTPAQLDAWHAANKAFHSSLGKEAVKAVDVERQQGQEALLNQRVQTVAGIVADRMTGPADLFAALKGCPASGARGFNKLSENVRAAAFNKAIATAKTPIELRLIFAQLFTSDGVIDRENAVQVRAFIAKAGTIPGAFDLQQFAAFRYEQAHAAMKQ